MDDANTDPMADFLAALARRAPTPDRTRGMLETLAPADRAALARHLAAAARALGDPPEPAWVATAPEPGDFGWIVERHGALYAAEYGFDHRFEALVARVAGEFLATRDRARERAWIARRRGERIGSAMVVRASDDTAKLRLVLVEPSARGLGVGKGLVALAMAKARAMGYRRMVLWTNDVLVAARAIYRAAGFRMVSSAPHADFGPAVVGEEWAAALDAPGSS